MRKMGGKIEHTQSAQEDRGGPHFHYKRQERMNMPGGNPNGPDTRPWIKRNRATFILLLDLSLIVIIFIIYNVFLKPNLSTEDYEGHSYELKALEFDGEILATVRITALEEFTPGSAGLVNLAVSIGENSEVLEQIQELLPEDDGAVRIVRFRLPMPDNIDRETTGKRNNENLPKVYVTVAFPGDVQTDARSFSITSPLELE